jgi:hypothetical protein
MKKSAKLSVIVAVAVLFSASANGELVTLFTTQEIPTNSFVLLAGDGARLEHWVGLSKINIQTTNSTFDVVSPYFYATANGGKFSVGGPATITVFGSGVATFDLIRLANPNTVNVIPKGQGAIVQLQTTDDLVNAQWMTLFSQAYTNSTPTNKFFKFSLSPL